ncbi:MAG: DUF6067 family protein [bacterium]|nr:DUF6067 family protein [bacterium]
MHTRQGRINLLLLAVAVYILGCAGNGLAQNMLQNGSFEQGLAYWYNEGIVPAIVKEGPDGNRAMKCEPGDKPSWVFAFQTVPVEPGAVYEVSFRVNSGRSSGMETSYCWKFIAKTDSKTTPIVFDTSGKDTAGQYAVKTYKISIPNDARSVSLRLGAYYAGTWAIYDAVEMNRVSTSPSPAVPASPAQAVPAQPDNLLRNHGFGQDMANWRAEGPTPVIVQEGPDGSKALRCEPGDKNAWSAVSQTAPIEAGFEYEISFHTKAGMKPENKKTYCWKIVVRTDSATKTIVLDNNGPETTGKFGRKVFRFIAPTDARNATISLGCWFAGTWAIYDDICLSKLKSGKDPFVEVIPLLRENSVAFVLKDMALPKRNTVTGSYQVLAGDGKIVAEGQLLPFTNETAVSTIHLDKQITGKCLIKYQLSNGNILMTSGERALVWPEIPIWLKERVGMQGLSPDYVPNPWMPVKVKGDTISVWGREYSMGMLALPQKVVTAGLNALAGQILLEGLTTSDERIVLAPSTALRCTAKTDGKASFCGTATSGKTTFSGNSNVTYDGLIRSELTVAPATGTRFKELTLSIPFSAEFARHYFFSRPLPGVGVDPLGGVSDPTTRLGAMKNGAGIGVIPDKQGIVFENAVDKYLSFWIGNDRAGLLCAFETPMNFWPNDDKGKPVVISRLERRKDVIWLKITMISAEFPCEQTFKYYLNFMATPVKPLPSGWRNRQWYTVQVMNPNSSYPGSLDDEDQHQNGGNTCIFWPTYTGVYGTLDPTVRQPVPYREVVSAEHARGSAVVHYIAPHLVGYETYEKANPENVVLKNPWADFCLPEWHNWTGVNISSYPLSRYPGLSAKDYATRAAFFTQGTSYDDYMLWVIREHARLGMDAIYSDGSLSLDFNPITGECGLVGFDNRRYARVMLGGYRDFCQRMYAVLAKERGVVRNQNLTGLGMLHMSGTPMVQAPFFDAWLTGEHLLWERPQDWKKDDPYPFGRYFSSLEKFRIEYSPHHWGVPMVFINEFYRLAADAAVLNKDTAWTKTAVRDFMLLMLLHDVQVWIRTGGPIGDARDEMYKTWVVQKAFGLGDDDVIFYPYWEKSPSTADREAIKITAYAKPGKFLAVVANTAFEQTEATVNIDLKQLKGLKMPKELADGMSGRKFLVKGGICKVNLPPRDFLMLTN